MEAKAEKEKIKKKSERDSKCFKTQLRSMQDQGVLWGTPWSPPSTPCGETQKASILGLGLCVSRFLLRQLQCSHPARVSHPMPSGQQIPSRTLTKAPSLSLPQVPRPREAEPLATVTQVAGGRGESQPGCATPRVCAES